jgi:hypothetical protein
MTKSTFMALCEFPVQKRLNVPCESAIILFSQRFFPLLAVTLRGRQPSSAEKARRIAAKMLPEPLATTLVAGRPTLPFNGDNFVRGEGIEIVRIEISVAHSRFGI